MHELSQLGHLRITESGHLGFILELFFGATISAIMGDENLTFYTMFSLVLRMRLTVDSDTMMSNSSERKSAIFLTCRVEHPGRNECIVRVLAIKYHIHAACP
jgi:hypothetical protein